MQPGLASVDRYKNHASGGQDRPALDPGDSGMPDRRLLARRAPKAATGRGDLRDGKL